MELNDYYLHAIYNNADMSFDEERTLRVLKEILDSGAIKSRRLRGISDTSCGGWNGLDYISICDYCRRNARPYGNNKFLIGYTAYETYIKKSLSFILKKGNITTIKPTLVAPVIFDWDSKFRMCELGNSLSGRFSDLPDELQVKDMISIDRVKGMTVPIDYMISEHMPFYKTSDCKEVPPYSAEDVIQFLASSPFL